MTYAMRVHKVNKHFIDNDKRRVLDLFRQAEESRLFYSVKDVSFDVAQGMVFGVLGPNGCGKSTLIRMMATLVTPDSGAIEIMGHDVVKEPAEVKDIIGRVSVDASFFMKLSAIENLDYAAGLYGLDRLRATKRARRILSELGFPESKLKTSVEKLSRGQQQKIAIARGFLARPKVLLLDEPTTGLDPVSKIDVQRYIQKEISQTDITIVITSHDMEEIDRLCDRLVIMADGAIIASGTSAELKTMHSQQDMVELRTENPLITLEHLRKLKGIEDPVIVRDKIVMRVKGSTKHRLLRSLDDNGIAFVSIGRQVPTLEDVFVKLTGKHLE